MTVEESRDDQPSAQAMAMAEDAVALGQIDPSQKQELAEQFADRLLESHHAELLKENAALKARIAALSSKYDSTLARVAGNIASGLAGRHGVNCSDPAQQQAIADDSVSLAQRIVAGVKALR